MTPEQLSDLEKRIITKLHERVKMVIWDSANIPERLIKSVAENCSSYIFPVIFKNEEPEQVSAACKRLVDNGYLKLFKDSEGYPCFIPPSYSVTQTKLREIKQSDIS